MNRTGLLLALAIFAGSTQAGIIDIITGADMAGMKVTANFSDGSSETATYVVLSDPQPRPMTDDLAAWEAYSGGATGSTIPGWSLVQRGRTFGDYDPATMTIYGAWTVTNSTGVAMTSMVIDALAGNIVFDNLEGVEGTPGSAVGRPFASGPGVVGVFSDPYMAPDLWGTLTLTWANNLTGNQGTQVFLADTDKIPVPATVFLLAVGSLGLALRRVTGRSLNKERV